MATVLGIDTATTDAAVAVTRDGSAVEERLVGPRPDGRPRHAQVVLAEAEAAIATAGGWEQIELVAIGIGPGSYTGLRIGIATARALAQSLGLPLGGVCTLATLARAIGEHPQAAGVPRLAAIDARRGQLFASLYDPAGELTWGPLVAEPAEVAELVAREDAIPLAAGDGALRFQPDLEAAGATIASQDDPVHRIAARHLCVLAESLAPRQPQEIEPLYLRAPDAEIWLERDHR
ncbi:MAG: tRNA (adenosine(37)-N6)-threonylcarbamoyltransferase complex dimerization subunit type 1 TsaB [Solirubrobacterales bacterium]